MDQYKIKSCVSADGTTIGYREYGRGPGLVLVQGAMGGAHNFHQLATALADGFTVYAPDRRGRGMSALEFARDHTIDRDVEDLDALLRETGAHHVFGLSSGALIALRAACSLPSIRRLAVYEPPFYSGGAPTAAMGRLMDEIDRGDLAGGLVTGMRASRMGPPVLHLLPDFLLKGMVRWVMGREERAGCGEYLSMRALAPSLRYDFVVVSAMAGRQDGLRSIAADVLLLGGSRSNAYLVEDLDVLERTLPSATRVELAGLDHAAAWNHDRRRNPNGKAEVVAGVLREFFLAKGSP